MDKCLHIEGFVSSAYVSKVFDAISIFQHSDVSLKGLPDKSKIHIHLRNIEIVDSIEIVNLLIPLMIINEYEVKNM